MRKSILALMGLYFAGCSGMYRHSLEFNPQESLRVAVVPFVHVDEDGRYVDESGELLVDEVLLLSEEVDEPPRVLLRKIVHAELRSSTVLDVLSPALIDAELPHHGFAQSDGSFDLMKIHSADPRELCTHFLDCDAVLYGRVTKWDRSYYGVQSVNSVGIELELISVRTAEPIFSAAGFDSDSRGLSKGPTGYSSVVLEPIRGLDAGIIEDLARRVVKATFAPLAVSSRPEYLEAPPPAIFATSHDVPGGTLMRDRALLVVLFGSPGMAATFSIGSVIENIPMIERSEGHYFGEYFPLATDSFSRQPVVVRLRDANGRESEQTVAHQEISLK